MAEELGAQVTKTGLSLDIADARMMYKPVTSGNCLDLAVADDRVNNITYAWSGTGYAIFFKANIRSTPSSAARFITNDSNEIMLTVTGIKVQHNGSSVTSNTVLVYNEWHDYAIVWDGEFVRYYRDGTVVSNNYFTTAPTTSSTSYNIFNRTDGQRNCDMQVAYMQWFNKSFTPQQVFSHYRQTPNDTTNLVYSYKFNEGTGTDITDSSGNGLHSTITGCTWSTFDLPHSYVTYMGAASIASLR